MFKIFNSVKEGITSKIVNILIVFLIYVNDFIFSKDQKGIELPGGSFSVLTSGNVEK